MRPERQQGVLNPQTILEEYRIFKLSNLEDPDETVNRIFDRGRELGLDIVDYLEVDLEFTDPERRQALYNNTEQAVLEFSPPYDLDQILHSVTTLKRLKEKFNLK